MKLTPFLIISFLLFLEASTLAAQEESVPYLKCHYTEKYVDNLNKPDRYKEDEMVLLISRECSAFFSIWYDSHWQVLDSILSRGGGLEECLAAEAKILYPKSTQGEYIYKNLPEQGVLTHWIKIFGTYYLNTDRLKLPQWEIMTERKTIAGYDCQLARANFGGRLWSAWFATDLPVSDGPWKLCGLPGLILEATDSEGHYHFTCIEINRVSGGKPIAIPKRRYIRCSKTALIDTYRLWKEDMNKFIRKRGKEPPKTLQSDGSWKEKKGDVKFNYIERLTSETSTH